MKDWVKVYTTENAFSAEVLKQSLTENEIPAVVINKQISAYQLGTIEVLVHPDNEERALAYIREHEI